MPTEMKSHVLPTGAAILVYYKSSNQNERNEWIPATVPESTEHSVVCRRHERGLPMNVAYGDVRLLPDDALAKRLATVDADEESDDEEALPNVDAIPETVGALKGLATGNAA